jgi:hypothetical protein
LLRSRLLVCVSQQLRWLRNSVRHDTFGQLFDRQLSVWDLGGVWSLAAVLRSELCLAVPEQLRCLRKDVRCGGHGPLHSRSVPVR